MNDWKSRLGVVYSTNPDFEYDNGAEEQVATLDKNKQKLRVWRDTHGRAGKVATVIKGFVGSEEDIEQLGKLLKHKIGVGGSVKDGQVIIQGENRDRVLQLLLNEGYTQSKKV